MTQQRSGWSIWVGMVGAIAALAQPLAAQANDENVDEWVGGRVDESAQLTYPSTPLPIHPSTRHPAATVDEWITQIAQATVQITGVRVESTEAGLQVVLETAAGELSAPTTRSLGNALIIDIPNAVLTLPDGGEFQQASSTAGIAFVSVTGLPDNQVRVSITGDSAPPSVAVSPAAQGLVLAITPGLVTETEATEEAIQLVVTATRTEEELQNIPRSVTVITQEDIEQQTRFSEDLGDILSQLVPGFSAPTGRTNTFGQTLRGREISVLIDGIPQNSNLGSVPAALTTIDPRSVERIEVVRGPNAIYGGQATGGSINIITRQPDASPVSQTIDIGGSAAFNEAFLTGDGFGYNALYSVSAATETASILGSLSYTSRGVYYDAEGDRIPSDLTNAETDEVNLLIRLGGELSPTQRLNFTFNHFSQIQNVSYISDPEVDNIAGVQKARAIELPAGTQIIDAPNEASLETTNLTLQYFHDDLLNSEVSGQVFFRNYEFVGGLPTDLREFFGIISQSPGSTQQWGGRLQVNTSFNPEDTLSLLWGVDYVREDSSQRFNLFAPDEFDASGGLVFRKIGEVDFVPPYRLNDLGIFAQLQWDVVDRLTLSGGARYVNLNIDTDDYTTYDGNSIEGGTLTADDVVFNLGLAYEVVDNLTAFASFSQGFSLPDIGRVLRFAPAGFAVESGIDLTQPQKVDNYEIGLRGNWNTVQASLAAFYNYSSLGTRFAVVDDGPLQTVRSPQRVYGIEGALDWQPSDRWSLGGTAAWLEGEDDADEDGDFTALNSLIVPPFKLTAYVENETLPGWRNRLQLLFSGNRDRGFNAGADDAPINSYITLDLLSGVRLGNGELTLGIQNLLNTQYYPVYSQYFAPFSSSDNRAGQGRTMSLSYRTTF
ncbi:TonB-dependent receptor [Nodosilinea sp. FACHB-131]|uniref:TonB-dependent receptor domain-containing protein n=1 Tax=Cyanophyceae TaxID=3028117 RepID=UPI001689ED85|nr:TonB-dependent receptor [Nodosilinea sp. FACHB-131]MBD1874965.1 TonB-dependent receptor [Nodosilinea sp. FACHB-131]